MRTVKLKKQSIKKIQEGNPLLQKEDLLQSSDETLSGEWVKFVDFNGSFIAKGYLGTQNKGIGWVVSNEDIAICPTFYEQIFRKAFDKRRSFFSTSETTAFRIFNGEGDGLGGVTLDYYQGYVVFSWYNATLYQEATSIYQAFRTIFPEVKGIYEKIRFKNENLAESRQVSGEVAEEPLIVSENGIRYAVYLNEGLMTGIFLDQREVRGALAEGFAAGDKVLNTFSYTGAFSVAAAMGGASQTVSVDLAKRSFEKTKEQLTCNQLELENNHIFVMDIFEYFRYAQRKGLIFDLIILDPPSFARNGKKTFSVQKNYGELIQKSVTILAKKGKIIASTNASNVSLNKFRESIEEEFERSGVSYRLERTYRLPQDFQTLSSFKEGNYLKVLFYEIEK